MRKKLILDLDTGIDDAMAIAYALGSADEADLIGVTAAYGNVAVPLVARNVFCATTADCPRSTCSARANGCAT